MTTPPAGAPLRLVIADDQASVRQGLVLLLDAVPDIEVVGAAADGEQALTTTLHNVHYRQLPGRVGHSVRSTPQGPIRDHRRYGCPVSRTQPRNYWPITHTPVWSGYRRPSVPGRRGSRSSARQVR